MFVPLSLLVQQESTLSTPEDVIQALDRWVLPKYPTFTSANPAMTKVECMGVIHSFAQAGKLHLRLKPVEVDKAVDAFLEDRLWVNKDILETIRLLPNQRPDSWMPKPTFFRILTRIPYVWFEALTVTLKMLQIATTYTFYLFTKERGFTVPKAPVEKKPATVTLIKKDS